MDALSAAFEQLQNDEVHGGLDGADFIAVQVPGLETHRVASDDQGAPTILLRVAQNSSFTPAPIVLENIGVQHNVLCRILFVDGSVERQRFTIVRFRGKDRELRAHFLRVLAPVLSALGDEPEQAAVTAAINHLIRLFSGLNTLPRKQIQGLWAEVFVIVQALDSVRLASAWHADPYSLYDFSRDSENVEVKSFSGMERIHHFTLDQLNPATGTTVAVISVRTLTSYTGVTLSELLSRLRSRVADPHLQMHVDRVVAATLGEQLATGLELPFDYRVAVDSMAVYNPADIPSVNPIIPPAVSNVRFRSDLTGLPAGIRSFPVDSLYSAVM
ncbi:MAG TPA: PD-(D/E)XK motif protein [Longimicrobium sp.]|nr:PD-(D/E)XK motif protein [Longimicrobium sp.]